jgi:hypothetical protein
MKPACSSGPKNLCCHRPSLFPLLFCAGRGHLLKKNPVQKNTVSRFLDNLRPPRKLMVVLHPLPSSSLYVLVPLPRAGGPPPPPLLASRARHQRPRELLTVVRPHPRLLADHNTRCGVRHPLLEQRWGSWLSCAAADLGAPRQTCY